MPRCWSCALFRGPPDVRNDYDNFYWSMDTLCRIVEFYGERLSPCRPAEHEAEDAALEMMWLWAKEKENSALADAEWRE